MNIYDFAMKMEKDGEEYLRRAAERAPTMELKLILGMLAEEEVRHYETIKAMKQKEKDPGGAEDSGLIGVKNIFQQMMEKERPQPGPKIYENMFMDDGDLNMYRELVNMESYSFAFYRTKAREEEREEIRKLFFSLAEEEKEHEKIMNNLVTFILESRNRPVPALGVEELEG
ncbi:ferritin family protein [Fibrobacterota bacterium]